MLSFAVAPARVAAPALAALAAVAVVGVFALRRPAPLSRLVPAAHAPSLEILRRLGRLGLVRTLVAAPTLEATVAAAGTSTDADRVAGAAVSAAIAISVAVIALSAPVSWLAPVLFVAAMRAPAFVVGRIARRRMASIDRDVPLLLDVLSLASFAGLPPVPALSRAIDVIDGPLAEEVSEALEDVELGARWRERFAELADEVPAPDLRRTIAVLLRSESVGASTAEPIAILADDVRASRYAAATERARKAPVQMLFPLVFLVLPAFLLLTVVPVLVATLGSIR